MKSLPKEWIILIVIVIIIAIIAISDWQKSSRLNRDKPQISSSSVSVDIKSGNKQEKEEANVTVVVEYLKDKSDDKNMTFAVSLDTHSVDLNSFDFQKDISLEAGTKSSNPTEVTTNGSDHHRSGEIIFKKTPPPFTLALKNIANINRREFLFEKLQ